MKEPLSPEENDNLWEKFLEGDAAAVEHIFCQYIRPLTLYCLSYVNDEATANDIATDALLKIKSMAESEKIRNPEGLLYTMVKNNCLTHIRNVKNRGNILGSLRSLFSFTQKPEVENKMSQEDIDKFLQRIWETHPNLTETDRQIWDLHQKGYKNPEIAEMLGVEIALVERRKHIIRKILKDGLDNDEGFFLSVGLFCIGLWEVIYVGLKNVSNYVCLSTPAPSAQS